MSIYLSTHENTAPFNDRHTVIDTGFAAVQGALVVGLCNKFNVLSLANIGSGAISNIGAGATVGASLRLARKVSELALNFTVDKFFSALSIKKHKHSSWVGKTEVNPARITNTMVAIAVARKIADIALTAGIVSIALPALSAALPPIVPAISMKFTTYLAFAAFENIRPFTAGSTLVKHKVADFGPRLSIDHDHGKLEYNFRVLNKKSIF